MFSFFCVLFILLLGQDRPWCSGGNENPETDTTLYETRGSKSVSHLIQEKAKNRNKLQES
ncbi:hypothetical protein GCM10008941_22180 [Rhizomicrobium palustre]